MATLGSATGILSHHLKLIGDSGIRSDQLQSLHSSGLFSILFRCSDPHKVDRDLLRRVLMVRDGSPEALRDLCRKKLQQAARAREQGNMGGQDNWYDCMKESSALLRWIYRELSNEETVLDPMHDKRVNAIWRPLSNRYQAEACALLLLQAYGSTCENLDEAHSLFDEATKNSVPCHVCHWLGYHYGGLQCGACLGTKLLSTRVIECPECGGSGEGDAYIPSCGGLGVCGHCMGERKTIVDSLGKHVSHSAVYMLQISQTL